MKSQTARAKGPIFEPQTKKQNKTALDQLSFSPERSDSIGPFAVEAFQ